MADQDRNQGQKRFDRPKTPPKPKWTIIFSAGNATKVDGQYLISVNVQVHRDGANQINRQVEIIYAGATVYNNLVTDLSGRASGRFAIAAKAGEEAILTAVLLGSDNASSTARVNIPEEKKPKERQPIRADIEKKGKDGCYVIIGQILDADGKGVKTKLIFTEALGKEQKTILLTQEQDTEDDGTIKIVLKDFKEPRRTIDVRVAGTALEKTLVLDGPDQPMFRKPVKGGFLKNLKRK